MYSYGVYRHRKRLNAAFCICESVPQIRLHSLSFRWTQPVRIFVSGWKTTSFYYLCCILVSVTFSVSHTHRDTSSKEDKNTIKHMHPVKSSFLHNEVVQVRHSCECKVSRVRARGRKQQRKWGQSSRVALNGRNREETEIREQEDDALKNPASTLTCVTHMGRQRREMRVSEWHSPKESDPSCIIK